MSKLNITVISDTHTLHGKLRLNGGDMLIHCGYFSGIGKYDEVESFLKWFYRQPYKYRVFICGNHEVGLYDPIYRHNTFPLIQKYTQPGSNCFYLENSSVEIAGFKIYGSPITPFFFGWAWNVERGAAIKKYWDKIPDDTNILISHGPPYGILDSTIDNGNQGCEMLAKRITQLKELKLSCHGHLHHSGGQIIEKNGIKHINAAICTDQYVPSNPPVIVDIEL